MWYDCQCLCPVVITWLLGFLGWLPAIIWNIVDIGCVPSAAEHDRRVNARLGRSNNTTTVVTTTQQQQPVVVQQPVAVVANPVVAQPVAQTTVVQQ